MTPDPDTVCDEYATFAEWLAWRLYRRHRDRLTRDEVIQAVRLGLWRAAMINDPAKPEAFTTFAAVLCRNAVHEELRSSLRGPQTVPLAESDVRRERSAPSPDPDLWERIAAHLTAREYRAVELHFRCGLGWKLVAKELGVTRDTVRDSVLRAMAKLRATLGDEVISGRHEDS